MYLNVLLFGIVLLENGKAFWNQDLMEVCAWEMWGPGLLLFIICFLIRMYLCVHMHACMHPCMRVCVFVCLSACLSAGAVEWCSPPLLQGTLTRIPVSGEELQNIHCRTFINYLWYYFLFFTGMRNREILFPKLTVGLFHVLHCWGSSWGARAKDWGSHFFPLSKGKGVQRSELKGRVPGQQVYPRSIQLICLHHSWGTRHWGSCLLNWGEQAEIHLGPRVSHFLCSGGASGWPRTLVLFWRKVLLYSCKPLPPLEYLPVNAHHMLHEKPREIGTEEPKSQGWDEQTPEFCCGVAARFVPLCWHLNLFKWNETKFSVLQLPWCVSDT